MNNLDKIRLGVFLLVLVACALAERVLPRRVRVADAAPRWRANLGLALIGMLVSRLLLPYAAVEGAYAAEGARFGLLNQVIMPYPLKFALSFLFMDLLVYWQHRLFHWSPFLWRLHAVHHTDLDLDAGSGVRFHPGEIMLSGLLQAGGAALFGAHFLAVAVFEIVLNATSLFSHANLDLGPVDRALRLVLVTPDMHRIHHSPSREETDSNFGVTLPWWDRLFHTYRPEAREPQEEMTLGLSGARDPHALDLFSLLSRPLKRVA